MLTFLMYFLPNKPPNADVVGMRLTRDACEVLIDVCKAFKRLLNKQISDIRDLLGSQDFNTAISALTSIQERHAQIKHHLTDLIHRVQYSHAPWLDEFSDAEIAMGGKVKMCNHASNPFTLGWKAAAMKYWPWVAENYETLLGLLERLKDELQTAVQDETLWNGEARRQAHRVSIRRSITFTAPSTSKHVHKTTFSKRVAVRDIAGTELAVQGKVDAAPSATVHKDHTVSLTDDRRRTVEKYSGKRAQSGQLSPAPSASEAVNAAQLKEVV